MHYFAQDNLSSLFETVHRHLTQKEHAPSYEEETAGVEKLLGVFERVRADNFYPSLVSKAACLFIQINKGHFFSNGNKRLALAIAVGFLQINESPIQQLPRITYHKKLTELFPTFTNYQNFDDFHPEEFGFYHLSIIVADSAKYIQSFDELKEKVESFIKFSIESIHLSGGIS